MPGGVDPLDRPLLVEDGQQVGRNVPHPVSLGRPLDDALFERDVEPAQLL